MDRAALATYLATEYDTLLAEAGIAPADMPDGLAPVLDAVETLTNLSPDLSPVWHRPLARFYALQRIVNRLAVNMDVSTGGDSYRLSQQFANASTLLAAERASVGWLVAPMPETSRTGGSATIGIPYLCDEEGSDTWA